jgi:hypothetical protein
MMDNPGTQRPKYNRKLGRYDPVARRASASNVPVSPTSPSQQSTSPFIVRKKTTFGRIFRTSAVFILEIVIVFGGFIGILSLTQHRFPLLLVFQPGLSADQVTPQSFVYASADWMYKCNSQSWKIYTDKPTYKNAQGQTVGKNLYPNGDFWLLAATRNGYIEGHMAKEPKEYDCLGNAINVVHQYGGKVCGVLGADTAGSDAYWSASEVNQYEIDAVNHPSMFHFITDIVEQRHYDCVINDLEAGIDSATFTNYDGALRKALHSLKHPVLLGQTLISKYNNPNVLACRWPWQNDRALASEVDFFVIMAIDRPDDLSYDSGCTYNQKSGPRVTLGWIQDLYAYYKSVGIMQHPVAWEFPTYGEWDATLGSSYAEALHKVALKLSQLSHNDGKNCISLNFWDSDEGMANTIGWVNIQPDPSVKLC